MVSNFFSNSHFPSPRFLLSSIAFEALSALCRPSWGDGRNCLKGLIIVGNKWCSISHLPLSLMPFGAVCGPAKTWEYHYSLLLASCVLIANKASPPPPPLFPLPLATLRSILLLMTPMAVCRRRRGRGEEERLYLLLNRTKRLQTKEGRRRRRGFMGDRKRLKRVSSGVITRKTAWTSIARPSSSSSASSSAVCCPGDPP